MKNGALRRKRGVRRNQKGKGENMTGDKALVVATDALRNIVRLEGITAELIARKALLIIDGVSCDEAEDNASSEITIRDALWRDE
jgi:hypothetical protein